jgi:hypothetical protein
MYERFTDRARKVMQLANQEAQRLQHDYIGTEDILLGLAREGSGVAELRQAVIFRGTELTVLWSLVRLLAAEPHTLLRTPGTSCRIRDTCFLVRRTSTPPLRSMAAV